ncbi:MAG TPA: universal stress protein, partial [Planctomycetota bacterium]|nr:universal stress protein [Planctomycetota bacterium]
MIKNILVALDGSPRSERSLPWVRLLVPGAKVTLARFIEFIDPMMVGAKFIDELTDAARSKLEALAGTFSPKASIVLKQGAAAVELLKAARQAGADLIGL